MNGVHVFDCAAAQISEPAAVYLFPEMDLWRPGAPDPLKTLECPSV